MSDISIGFLLFVVFLTIVVAAFFASTETALMSLNRYRLRHKAQSGHRSAKLAEKLLAQPDRLIGIIPRGIQFIGCLDQTDFLFLQRGSSCSQYPWCTQRELVHFSFRGAPFPPCFSPPRRRDFQDMTEQTEPSSGRPIALYGCKIEILSYRSDQ